MSHKSDIGISVYPAYDVLNITINGWAICDIYWDEDDCLIKDKETAIEIAKSIVTLLEFKFGEVKNEDYPNEGKASPDIEMVEGYELPRYTQEEYEEYEKENGLDFLDCLFGDCD